MLPPVAYDLTRLCFAPPTVSPRGIDRVDIAFAKFFFKERGGSSFGILPTPWGTRCFDSEFGLRIVEWAEARWNENSFPEQDNAFLVTKARLLGNTVDETDRGGASKRNSTAREVVGKIADLIRGLGLPIGSSATRTIPNSAVYLNVGHVGLAGPLLLSWLDRRPDIKSAFMIHDVIPISHGEFVTVAGKHFHRAMLTNTARYASGLIVTTQTARESIVTALGGCCGKDVKVFSALLPVSPEFLEPARTTDEFSSTPYFIFCGTIEPRKNLMLLLNVWRELVSRWGSGAPKLVVVGGRGSCASETVEMLERCDALQNHVIEASGLSSQSLRRLLSGARALLMPSFAEGFGLPIIESLSVGTPVIASNIPAHREAGGDYATYLDPIDGIGWLNAITDFTNGTVSHSEGYIPNNWPQYFVRFETFLSSLV